MRTVTVLIEGYVKAIEGRQLIPGATEDGARNVAGTVTLIQDDHAIVVTDPGMVTERTLIVDALKKEGISPENVTHVFISHHHPDHTVNIALFPNAEVVDFWATYKGDLWQDHAAEYDIVPGITVLRTPGHTEEDASLIVRTDAGTYVLTHLWWLEDMTPGIDPLAWDQGKLEASRTKILAIADWIIPGHGKMFKNSRKGQP
ncbi:MAG: MBL fold metallo-hydrolase [Nitrospinae bacterium]|nr:MBL fold metallo-hydrolase [Nitrospinota bacterium]